MLRLFSRAAAAPGVPLRTYRTRVFRHERGGFARLRGTRVLIYWPHGLGDWVQLGYVLPLLEPTNRYWITRYGDDFVSLMEGDRVASPLYSGTRSTRNAFGAAATHFHLGVSYGELDGSPRDVQLAEPLFEAVRRLRIDAILWTDFPEVTGSFAFPFHTKARHLAMHLVEKRRLASLGLTRPLGSSLDLRPSTEARAYVEQRLRTFLDPSERLCIIGGAGHTEPSKNWGTRDDEARELVALLASDDPRWKFLSLADRALGAATEVWPGSERVVAYADLFGFEPPLQYGALLKALIERAALFVGVPAGPFHLAMARGDVPTVGIWLAHHPNLYDEPSGAARHLVGAGVRELGLLRRKGVTSVPKSFGHSITHVDGARVRGGVVLTAVESLLG